jgi:hypothetical protein
VRIATLAVGAVGKYAMSRAYLCVSVDTGVDEGQRGGSARSFRGITDGVLARIHPLFERFEAKPTYLLSAAVLGDPACVEAFRRLASSADLGTLRVVEPAPGEHDRERESLTGLTDDFIRALDHQPQSCRVGPSALGPSSLGILESLGYAVEASVTPHVGVFEGAPSQPYRADAGAPGRAGDSAILEVPVTIRRRLLNALPAIGGRISPQWLRPTHGTTGSLVKVAEDEVAAARRNAPRSPVVLHATFRNVDVVAGASSHASSEEKARGVLDRVRDLLTFARRAGITVIGLGDVPELLATSDRRAPRSSVP